MQILGLFACNVHIYYYIIFTNLLTNWKELQESSCRVAPKTQGPNKNTAFWRGSPFSPKITNDSLFLIKIKDFSSYWLRIHVLVGSFSKVINRESHQGTWTGCNSNFLVTPTLFGIVKTTSQRQTRYQEDNLFLVENSL